VICRKNIFHSLLFLDFRSLSRFLWNSIFNIKSNTWKKESEKKFEWISYLDHFLDEPTFILLLTTISVSSKPKSIMWDLFLRLCMKEKKVWKVFDWRNNGFKSMSDGCLRYLWWTFLFWWDLKELRFKWNGKNFDLSF
jgi:hypothetical protein